MIFSARIGTKHLMQLCQRLSTSLEAGIDMRKIWQREAEQSSGNARRRYESIRTAVAQGDSLSQSIADTKDFFPELFREMVEVGEKTGHLASVFGDLADHYENQLGLRRMFLGAIIWPILELSAAVTVIGFLIWIMGVLPGKKDILGLGLIGTDGLIKYSLFIACVVAVGFVFVQMVRRGVFWVGFVQRAAMYVPLLGSCLRTLALSRLAWALKLVLDVEMNLSDALPLALRSTHNARFTKDIPRVTEAITQGQEIHEALRSTRAYPQDFLSMLEVGEHSGKFVESMETISRQYQEKARTAIAALTILAGFAVLILVAAIIILLIIQIFLTSYLGPLNDALKNM